MKNILIPCNLHDQIWQSCISKIWFSIISDSVLDSLRWGSTVSSVPNVWICFLHTLNTHMSYSCRITFVHFGTFIHKYYLKLNVTMKISVHECNHWKFLLQNWGTGSDLPSTSAQLITIMHWEVLLDRPGLHKDMWDWFSFSVCKLYLYVQVQMKN